MASDWSSFEAGAFSLGVPPGWVVEKPGESAVLLQDEQATICVEVTALSRGTELRGVSSGESKNGAGAEGRSSNVRGADAQVELNRWLEEQRHVEIRQPARIIADATLAIATAEGVQRPRGKPGEGWLVRLLRRRTTMRVWRFWAVLNSHMTLLISCSGRPADMERQRHNVERVVRSVNLPEREILIGRRFTDVVVSFARSWFPQTRVTVIDDVHLQFGSQNVSLLNLHRQYLESPDDLPTQVHSFLCTVQGELPASEVARSWAAARERVLPMFLTRTAVHNHPSPLAHEPWVNGLAITYVLEDERPSPSAATIPQASDLAATMHAATDLKTEDSAQLLQAGERAITVDDLARWRVSPEELHEEAVRNLVVQSHEHTMQGQKGAGFTMLCLGGGGPAPGVKGARADRHNAARLLLPELHRKLREHLGATFYAAIPTRDLLLAFSTEDEAVLGRVREQVAADFTRSFRGLSPKLFLVTPDGIAGDPHDEEDFAG